MGRKAGSLAVGTATALALLGIFATVAVAELSFCGPGEAAGQCEDPQGLATDFETGRLFVADRDNHRINVFDEAGEFQFAFGWGVDSGAEALETCTTASGCQKGKAGAGAGQLSSPHWVALDNAAGSPNLHHIYVSDSNFRISHFDESGAFIEAFGWGVQTGAGEAEVCTTGSGCLIGVPGEGFGECQIGGNRRPVSVGPGGNVFVAISAGEEPSFTAKVEKFGAGGECLAETVLIEGNFRLKALAVDSAEDAYVSVERAKGETRKYDLEVAEIELCDVDDEINTNELALDAAGHLFAYQREGDAKNFGSFEVITEYDAAACPPSGTIRRFGYDKFGEQLSGLAALQTPEGEVFASELDTEVLHIGKGGPGPVAIEESLEVLSIGNAQADLYAEVNPEGKATEVTVEVVDAASYAKDKGEGGSGFDGEGVKSQTEELAFEAADDFRATAVEIEAGCEMGSKEAIENGECLVPETEYHWRIRATNEDDATGEGEAAAEGEPFETKAPIEVLAAYAGGIDTGSATLNALVNPLGIAASGYFEYVTEAEYDKDKGEGGDGYAAAGRVPVAGEVDFGFGEAAIRRSAAVSPLAPGTAYRFRVVASSALADDPVIVEGAPFATYAEPGLEACPNGAFRTGAGALLPDCRGYEMVSPLDKEGGDIAVLDSLETISQAGGSGERFAYGSYRAFGDTVSAPIVSQYLAQRDAGEGWQNHGISPPKDHLIKGGVELGVEFRAFSEELCQGWLVPTSTPTLTEDAEADHKNLYRRDDRLCGEEGYGLFSAGEPENLSRQYRLELQGIAAAGTVAAFMANDTLLGTPAPAQVGCGEGGGGTIGACATRLYLKGPEGPSRFACIDELGDALAGNCSAGSFAPTGVFGSTRSTNVKGALAEDAGRLYFTDSLGAGEIFLRENPLGPGGECAGGSSPCSYEVSRDGEEEAGTTDAFFVAAAAADGSTAYYTTGPLGSGGAHLFAFDAGAKESSEVAGEVFGVLAVSEDGTRVYFSSGEILEPGAENAYGASPEEDEPNLYLAQAGAEPRFIAVLSDEDVDSQPTVSGTTSTVALDAARRNTRITPSGEQLAFMSDGMLSDFDNTAAGGEGISVGEEVPVNEVYLYDAPADELICASCNPGGARPIGENIGIASDPQWIAARMTGQPTALNQGQNLVPAGDRLFFESLDPLTPRDTNGRLDIYQWERAGSGGCEEGDPTFSAAAAGCIDMLTSGQGVRDAVFLGSSASGDDTFFTTLVSLVAPDYGLVDVYDARVGGGFPAPPPPSPECEGETCQSPAPAPQFGLPSTSTYLGPGNLAAPKKKAKRCPKGKRKVKRKGKMRCVKKKGMKASRVHRRHRAHNRAVRLR